MEVMHPRCCGLEVHKVAVVACVRLVIYGKTVKKFRTATGVHCADDVGGVSSERPWAGAARRDIGLGVGA